MKKFVKIQQDILDAVSLNQLVSAGAGSGKTTVMIEKIANLIIEKKVKVDELLVVTFTVLAATEMKDRLIAKIKDQLSVCEDEDKQYLINVLEQIKTASIDTIDGFSSKTIKKYFYELGVSPNIEIISDTTRDYFLSQAMKKTFDSFIKSGDKLNIMLDIFGGNARSLANVKDLILNSYNNISNLENYQKFLTESLNEYVDSIKSEKTINDYICDNANRLVQKIMYAYTNFDLGVKTKLDCLIDGLQAFDKRLSFVSNLTTLNSLVCPKFSVKENKENFDLKELNIDIKQFFKIKNNLEINQINCEFTQKNQKIYEYFNIFIEILINFINNYNKIKEKNNLIDFNDLNRLMLKLLENEKIALELQSKYKYVFIDEYQDVNPLQDSIMKKLVGQNTHLFTVGDVKQSIYGFRGSSPEWFLEKYNSLKANNNNGDVFDMNVNFRSNPKILNFINEIFCKLMTKDLTGIDYKNDCMIQPKRDDIVDDKVHIMLIKSNQEKQIAQGVYSVKNHTSRVVNDEKQMEADLVLKTISELVGTTFYDANLKSERILTYKDIAILTRSEKDENTTLLVNVLRNNGVPVNIANKLETQQSEGIKLILSILKCVSNIADDVDYLATFLALTDMDLDDVTEIRDHEKSLLQNFKDNIDKPYIQQGFDLIDKIRQNSYTMSNSELIRAILNEQKLKYYLIRKKHGEKELLLIEEFLNKLSNVEDGLSLVEFVDVVVNNVSRGSDFITMDNQDSVTIQTIHKSKGLEYPVVFLYNAGKMFSYLREHDSINFNADIGFGVDYFDFANRIKMDSLTKHAIKLKNAEKGYKEELRLLYVALTRAKNKLFITGALTEKAFTDEISKNSYLNMILSCFENRTIDGENEFVNCKISVIEDITTFESESGLDHRRCISVGEGFVYPQQEKFVIPFKNSVTGINSEKSQQIKFATKDVFNTNVQYDYDDRALVGTHYHIALELLDYAKPYEQNTNFDDVDYNKIKKAHEIISGIAKNALSIKKEADFMLYVPYNQIVDSNIGNKVLVQGIVDLLLEYKDYFVIIDYKFSSLPIEILKQKYTEQLSLYKLAVEKAYNKKVDKVLIYSINTGELL
ncbi:MAG: UvrD-helicase domain-containing protein [Clostridia bacterium]|nr:UvrD-helicase domain-containing protein [Clostridia bacterium]